ncbi:MAG TPA: signal peptidase II [Armatimonadota bacterium]
MSLLVAAIDQGVKRLVVEGYPLGESHSLIPGVLDLSYRQNTGAAFSLFHHAPTAALIAVNILVLGFFLALVYPHLRTRSGSAAAVLVLGGALGNLLDRVRWHYVVDYIDFRVWPVFNIADMCIVAGVGLLVLVMIRAEWKRPPSPGSEHA